MKIVLYIVSFGFGTWAGFGVVSSVRAESMLQEVRVDRGEVCSEASKSVLSEMLRAELTPPACRSVVLSAAREAIR